MFQIAYGLIYAFSISPILALGLFAMGCSSGGGASNQWSLLLNGDINLSIVMTFLSTMSALGRYVSETYAQRDLTTHSNIWYSISLLR